MPGRWREAALIGARVLLVLGVAGLMLWVPYLVARQTDDPDLDTPAQVFEALAHAYNGEPHGGLTFQHVAGGGWTRLYVFRPLATRRLIARRLTGLQGAGATSHHTVHAGETLLVFVDRTKVLGSARVPRARVDMSCVHPLASRSAVRRLVVRRETLRVIRTGLTHPPLFAGTSGTRSQTRRCLRRLPGLS